jgi:hypothetical protein
MIKIHRQALMDLPPDLGYLHMYFAEVKTVNADLLCDLAEKMLFEIPPDILAAGVPFKADSLLLVREPEDPELRKPWFLRRKNFSAALAAGIISGMSAYQIRLTL